jgi:hypothetical protein
MTRSAGQAVAVNAVMFTGELGAIMAVLASGIDTISIKHRGLPAGVLMQIIARMTRYAGHAFSLVQVLPS